MALGEPGREHALRARDVQGLEDLVEGVDVTFDDRVRRVELSRSGLAAEVQACRRAWAWPAGLPTSWTRRSGAAVGDQKRARPDDARTGDAETEHLTAAVTSPVLAPVSPDHLLPVDLSRSASVRGCAPPGDSA